MNSHVFSLQKFVLALAVTAVTLFAFAETASAQSYYYYQPAPWSYQNTYRQPVVQYNYQYNQRRAALLSQLQSLQRQLAQLQSRYQGLYGNVFHSGTNFRHHRRSSDYDIDVDTESARNIDDDEATLRGDIDLDGARYADVWFEYGEDSDLDEESDTKRVFSDGTFSIRIDDLDDDERYFYRAIAEDPNGDRSYGQIRSFEADDFDDDDDRNDDEPDADTRDADDIDEDSAEIHGRIDMNDFNNGLVFFVWGEDEDEVEDVEDEDSFSDVDEDGDDLQKHRVDSDLDGERTYWLTIHGLDDDTDYYYRICVEYEDDDDDDTLECGDVEDFETD